MAHVNELPLWARRIAGRFFLPVAIVMGIGHAEAQADQDKEFARLFPQMNNSDMRGIPVASIKQDTAKPEVVNGKPANTMRWRASYISTAGTQTCTATLIGPRVVLTAAHCVGHGARIELGRLNSKDKYQGKCYRYKDWGPANPSPDIALCEMEADVQEPGLAFESVSLDHGTASKGARLTLAGYGCIDIETEKKNEPPQFVTGRAYVEHAAGSIPVWPNWILTKSGADDISAIVCKGDSGGAVYDERKDGSRVVVAINSAVGDDKTRPDYKVSYLTSLSSTAVADFIGEWVKSGKKICGTSSQPGGCRGAIK